jgi:hypothetical protein
MLRGLRKQTLGLERSRRYRVLFNREERRRVLAALQRVLRVGAEALNSAREPGGLVTLQRSSICHANL